MLEQHATVNDNVVHLFPTAPALGWHDDGLKRACDEMRKQFDYRCFSLLDMRPSRYDAFSRHVMAHDWPDALFCAYDRGNFLADCSINAALRKRPLPLTWDVDEMTSARLDDKGERLRRLLDRHEISGGVSFGATGPSGLFSVLTFFGDRRQPSDEDLVQMTVCSLQIFHMASDRMHPRELSKNKLSTNAKACLAFLAQGLTPEQAADAMKMSWPDFCNCLNDAQRQISATCASHAVAIAMRAGLVD